MNTEKFFESKPFKIGLVVIGVVIVLLITFKLGEFIGFRKASFSYRWAENYQHNFAGPRGGFMPMGFSDKDFMEANGSFGKIIKNNGTTIVINSRNNIEKVISLNNSTIIKKFADDIKPADLKPDDFIVVIGEPNDQGQINAKFIRVLPTPPMDAQNQTQQSQINPSQQLNK